LLKKLGLNVHIPESGCCGMAGAFGFEKGDHYDVSIKCGERGLLPAVRKADDETLVIASGFSCHEQIVQQTDQKPLHIAELLHLAMTAGTPRPRESEKPPQSKTAVQDEHDGNGDGEHEREVEKGGRVVAGAVLAGLAGAYLLTRKKKHDEDE